MNEIIEKVRNFVEEECRKPTSKSGYDPFPYHFLPVAKIAVELAGKLGADREIVEIAALLHDIGSIIYGRENHHITGAKIAEEKLREFDYPEEKIKIIVSCIKNHRFKESRNRIKIEEKIIAEADALDSFDRLAGIFEQAYVYEKLSREEARLSVLRKLEKKWAQLVFDESIQKIKPKYEAVKLLLK